MKRVGNEPNPEQNNERKIPNPANLVSTKELSDILSNMSASMMDAAEKDNTIELDDDPGPAFPDPPEEQTQPTQRNMTLHSDEFYEKQSGFKPAIEHPNVRESQQPVRSKSATPAREIDLEHLDESMIMDMPEIKASSFKIIDMLDPKPKDKSLRFRWANCKNHVAGNLGKYLAIGFETAHIDDVDQKRTPIDPSMIDGTTVKYYDVLLLKINVIKLMELYKSNIIKSVSKLAKAKEKGLAEATRQFKSDISESGAGQAYNHYKQALGREPVEFFATE